MLANVVSEDRHFPVVAITCTSSNVSFQQTLFVETPVIRFPNRELVLNDSETKHSSDCNWPSIAVVYIDTLSRFDAFRTLPLTADFLHQRSNDDTISYDFHLLQSVAKRKGDALKSLINFSGRLMESARGGFHYGDRTFRPAAPLSALLEARSFHQVWFRDSCECLNSSGNGSRGDTFRNQESFDYRILCEVLINSCSFDTNSTDCIQRMRPSVRDALLRLLVRRQKLKIEPTFSLMEISSPLKYSNIERKNIDKRLAELMDAYNKNCGLVFILSGHGDFFSESYAVPYGNIAASNPFFAVTTSKRFLDAIGIDWKIMEKNTRRLITIHDISETIRDVVCSVNARGQKRDKVVRTYCKKRNGMWRSLKGDINEDRTCGSIGVPEPHMCVCNGESSFFRNDTINVAYADYSVGEINKIIQEQVTRKDKWSHQGNRNPFGRCEKIRGYKFGNVEILKSNNSYKIALDIWVLPSQTSAAPPFVMSEQYKVTLRQTHAHQDNLTISFIKLVDVDRITYNWYSEECRDQDVGSDYCLCDEKNNHTLKQFVTYKPKDMVKVIYKRTFGVLPYILNLHRGCLVLVIRDYNQSVSFEAANLCRDRTYWLRFSLFTRNMISSSGLAIETTTLLPLRYYFIGFARQASYALPNKRIVYKPLIGLSSRDCVIKY
jgi:hypothetical protein